MTSSHVPSAPAGAVHDAERALDALVADWSLRYGRSVAELVVTHGARRPLLLSGTVALPGQLRAALEALEAVAGGDVDAEVTVLVEADEHLGWLAPRRDTETLDVRSKPGGVLATQLIASDPPARCLHTDGAEALVELADGTVGWIDLTDTAVVGEADAPESVAEWRSSYVGAASAASEGAWRAAVEPWLGTPYVWGGATKKGTDCSGLTQRLVREVLGLGLPRHSSDQARRGRRVALDDLAPGDLVYLTQRETGTSHVALVIGGSDRAVTHACRVQGKVVTEPLEQLLERYKFRSGRRFAPEADSA
ncbi:MAG: C40 family peptidase [Anaerolineae bacterium]